MFDCEQKAFNTHMGLAIVAPITSTIRNIQLEVVLPQDLSTKGAILVYQLKSLDFTHRNIQFIERAPKAVMEQALSLVHVMTR